MGNLSRLLGPSPAGAALATALGGKPDLEPEPRLLQVVYWLWVATRHDVSPEGALLAAAQRGSHVLSEASRRQLLADWRVACTYGLLTPENLTCLRAGLPPVATDGRFAGRRIKVVVLRLDGPANDLGALALCPKASTLPPEARAFVPVAAPPPVFYAPPVPLPSPVRAGSLTSSLGRGPTPGQRPGLSRFTPAPAPVTAVPADPGGTRAEHIELHDVPFNDSLSLGGSRRLAVASDRGDLLSVSIIGDGPKVRRQGSVYGGRVGNTPYYNQVSNDYLKVDNSKVPKANPVRLPGVTGNAYLIHGEQGARWYYIDTVINNGSAFRIAKVTAGP